MGLPTANYSVDETCGSLFTDAEREIEMKKEWAEDLGTDASRDEARDGDRVVRVRSHVGSRVHCRGFKLNRKRQQLKCLCFEEEGRRAPFVSGAGGDLIVTIS